MKSLLALTLFSLLSSTFAGHCDEALLSLESQLVKSEDTRVLYLELNGAKINEKSFEASEDILLYEVGSHKKLGKYSAALPEESFWVALDASTCEVIESEHVK
ncbi:MAG: hypothetical protein VXV96_06935 [Bdellovibrionota bacterium]|nr:hypothetical protein [Bdellovibrionota bacterium]